MGITREYQASEGQGRMKQGDNVTTKGAKVGMAGQITKRTADTATVTFDNGQTQTYVGGQISQLLRKQ